MEYVSLTIGFAVSLGQHECGRVQHGSYLEWERL